MRYVFLAAGIIGILYYLRLTASSGSFTSISNPIEVDNTPAPSHVPHAPTPLDLQDGKEPEHIEHLEHLHASAPNHTVAAPTKPSRAPHPIDDLIEKAEKAQADLLNKESKDVKAAAAAYRARRGRHPPPGFDVWYDFAKENNVIMVEDFFDQIYHDLAPFWGLEPKIMRKEAHVYDMLLSIRKQKVKTGSDWFWTKIWMNMTQTIEDMLPDMDIPLNAMDEPRMVVPWEEINRLMEIERASRSMPDPHEVLSDFQELSEDMDKDVVARPKNFTETRRLSRTCYAKISNKFRSVLASCNSRMPSR